MSCVPRNEGNSMCQNCDHFDLGMGCIPTYNDKPFDRPPCGREVKGEPAMDERAVNFVRSYIIEHLDKSDQEPIFEVFIVWKCKVLQNWKWMISSTLFDGMYYEVTYNGDKKEFYLDAYKKFENRCIPDAL